ncbi:MAG: hypothetical protein AAFN27_23350 [Pseudomonadota bacterium]
MSYPIVQTPLRTVALCIMIYVGARMVTNLVTGRPIRFGLIAVTGLGIALAIVSGVIE